MNLFDPDGNAIVRSGEWETIDAVVADSLRNYRARERAAREALLATQPTSAGAATLRWEWAAARVREAYRDAHTQVAPVARGLGLMCVVGAALAGAGAIGWALGVWLDGAS